MLLLKSYYLLTIHTDSEHVPLEKAKSYLNKDLKEGNLIKLLIQVKYRTQV